jgi:hypothetical protein
LEVCTACHEATKRRLSALVHFLLHSLTTHFTTQAILGGVHSLLRSDQEAAQRSAERYKWINDETIQVCSQDEGVCMCVYVFAGCLCVCARACVRLFSVSARISLSLSLSHTHTHTHIHTYTHTHIHTPGWQLFVSRSQQQSKECCAR